MAQATGSRWQDLTDVQREILLPLAGTWDTLTSAHKGKWIALTLNYGTRSEDEQKKMQSRMLEWAALSQSQREQARINFAETKKVSASARAADWETYQALSADEKRELAANAKAKAKPTGAAIAVTPSPPGKLTAVPITRHTATQDSNTAAIKPNIDANTLLPVPTPPSAPVAAPAPAPIRPSPAVPLVNADTLSPN